MRKKTDTRDLVVEPIKPLGSVGAGSKGNKLISSSPSFDTEKFQLPRLPIVAR